MSKRPTVTDEADRVLHELAELQSEKHAIAAMKEHAALEWDVEFGAELTAARQSLEHVEARFASCNGNLTAMESRISKTDPLIPAIERKSLDDGEKNDE